MYECSFCGVSHSRVAKGPDVCICETCLEHVEQSDGSVETPMRCSFCSRPARESRWFTWRNRRIVTAGLEGDVFLCSSCVPIARNALEHNRQFSA